MFRTKQLLKKQSFIEKYQDTLIFVLLLFIGFSILALIGEPL